ncbi:MAG: hypothetical protein AAF969_10520 [Bacteroidota bacterium]
MVVVLALQQLFGAYHVLTEHIDDGAYETTRALQTISEAEFDCDLCAKLDSNPVVIYLYAEPVFYTCFNPLTHRVKEKTPIFHRSELLFQRGPPQEHL